MVAKCLNETSLPKDLKKVTKWFNETGLPDFYETWLSDA
jgi:hypothetical protein